MQKGYNKAYKLFFNLEYLTAAALSEANFWNNRFRPKPFKPIGNRRSAFIVSQGLSTLFDKLWSQVVMDYPRGRYVTKISSTPTKELNTGLRQTMHWIVYVYWLIIFTTSGKSILNIQHRILLRSEFCAFFPIYLWKLKQ